jgi:HSP20 family protein
MSLIRFKNSALPSLVENFIHRDASDLFQPFFPSVMPSVNIIDYPEGYQIDVAAPGLKKENFQVNLNNSILSITYHEEESNVESTGKYTRREFQTGSFKRSFSLPQTIENENISAQYVDGVLKLYLPKREEAKPRPDRIIQIN